jgi:hypothetical protein
MLPQIKVIVRHQEFAIDDRDGDADGDEAVRFGIGQAAKQEPIDDAEDGRGSADS